MRGPRAGCALALCLSAVSLAHADPGADGWITHPGAHSTPVVLQFRHELTLDVAPAEWPVEITADNRFILYVNGTRLASGPSTGTVARWRVATVDLAPALRRGGNIVAVTVWNFGAVAPLAQQSVATGLRITGPLLATADPGWRVRIDSGRGASSGREQIPWQYYAAGAPEQLDARRSPARWNGQVEAGDGWTDAVDAPAAAQRTLVHDDLPAQEFSAAAPGETVRSSLPGGTVFPGAPFTIPAHTTAKLLVRRDAMISAYPELEVAGGDGAGLTLTYAEALYDRDRRKGDRARVEGDALGIHDTFMADGTRRTLAPLWWRTWRFLEIAVTTADEPLTLLALRVNETGYPFEQVARFHSSDPQLDRIFDIGWRTLRVDAHETFMDSAYWEQLQYTGDTRLEMLITYAVSGDPRLARQAIEAFAEYDADDGGNGGRYPTREPQLIATFSLVWVGMLADWLQYQPDAKLIARHLPRLHRVLAWFDRYETPQHLQGSNPHWNFIDWSGQEWTDRTQFPSFGKDGGSCLLSAMWVGALRQAALLERSAGDPARAAAYAQKADGVRAAIRSLCWDAQRGLFADNPDRTAYSQHMNAFAVLYDIATRDEAPAILDRVVTRGIDAPPGLYASTYYFAWYLVRAFEHAGRADRYFDLLAAWRELLPLGFTTWPESRGETRSDTHAWSAHPTADLLELVAGIGPAASGYRRLRVEPHLGPLTALEATAATPFGPVSVTYAVTGDTLAATIIRPAKLRGEFVWGGKTYPLGAPRTRLTLPLR